MLELMNFEYAAVPLAAQIFDRFIKSSAAKKHTGTLYGVAALMVARKFHHDEGDMCVVFVCVSALLDQWQCDTRPVSNALLS